MSIDPRMMSQLLQLQFLSKLDLTGADSDPSSDSNGDGDFAAVLQSMLGQAQPAAPGKVIPASELLKMTRSYTPVWNGGTAIPSAGVEGSLQTLIGQAAARFDVDPTLVQAVIKQESDFDPNAVSTAGAKGLMQLMDDTAQGYGVTNVFDPEQNINAGTQFLSGLLNKYNGNEAMALAAYNAGPGRVDRLGVQTDGELAGKLNQLPQETRQYIDRVLAYKSQAQQQG